MIIGFKLYKCEIKRVEGRSTMEGYIGLVFIVFVYNVQQSVQYWDEYSSLQQVHVLFRHGDRTPDLMCIALNPNSSDNFWPDGYGALTLLGKQQEYSIGLALRKRYNKWLGNIYSTDILEARASDFARTKMSLLLVLAGLWPPSYVQMWDWSLKWQPIPYNYEKKGHDLLLQYPLYNLNYSKKYQDVLNTPDVKEMLKPTESVTNYIYKYFNFTSRPLENTYAAYFCLYVLDRLGKPLPDWSKLVYPNPLDEIAPLEYVLKTYNDVLKQYTGGQIIKKVLEEAARKISGELKSKNKKLFLYSAHEFNIAHVLRSMNTFNMHIPKYGSYILFELHRHQQTYGFKIFYQNYESFEPEPVVIPGCDQFCPIDDFTQLLSNVIPGPEIS